MGTRTDTAQVAASQTGHALPRGPEWATTEFWSMALTHVLALVAAVLALTGRGEDLSAAELAIPVIALVISSAVGAAYRHNRLRTKLVHAERATEGMARDLDRIRPLLTKDATLLEPIVGALDPAALKRLQEAADTWKSTNAAHDPGTPTT